MNDRQKWNEDKIANLVMDMLQVESYPYVTTVTCYQAEDCQSVRRINDGNLPQLVIDLLPKLYRRGWLGRVHYASKTQPNGKTLRYYQYYLI